MSDRENEPDMFNDFWITMVRSDKTAIVVTPIGASAGFETLITPNYPLGDSKEIVAENVEACCK